MNICEGLNDLILEKKTCTLQYIHITYPDYLDNIYLEGLRKSSGEHTNFGIDVIYVANKSDLTSIKALAELSSFAEEYNKEIILVMKKMQILQ